MVSVTSINIMTWSFIVFLNVPVLCPSILILSFSLSVPLTIYAHIVLSLVILAKDDSVAPSITVLVSSKCKTARCFGGAREGTVATFPFRGDAFLERCFLSGCLVLGGRDGFFYCF